MSLNFEEEKEREAKFAENVIKSLKTLARREDIKNHIIQDPLLKYKILLKASMRYIGGDDLAQCMITAKQINNTGSAVAVDFMGENTRNEQEVEEALAEFLRAIEEIKQNSIRGSIGYDLTHLGLHLNPEMAFENSAKLASAAQKAGLEVLISMESSEHTSIILSLYKRLNKEYSNVGITLQAQLLRSPADLEDLLSIPGKIRLVKGAYKEPAGVAHSSRTATTGAYKEMMEKLLLSSHSCSIATHDISLLQHAHDILSKMKGEGKDISHVEFEMMHGAAPERLKIMTESGYPTRAYLPYGKEWYLYLCHRLAEYPPNIYQAISDCTSLLE